MYQVILADPPWKYSNNRCMGAAENHYACMSQEDLFRLIPPRATKSVLFLWATCPLLPQALELMDRWKFFYRGVAYVWVKTTKDGAIIAGKGIPPTTTKPTTELVLVGATTQYGRPLPLHSMNQPQVVLAPPTKHSEKPEVFQGLIEELFGPNTKRLEMFARKRRPNWDAFGNEVEGSITIVPRST